MSDHHALIRINQYRPKSWIPLFGIIGLLIDFFRPPSVWEVLLYQELRRHRPAPSIIKVVQSAPK